MTFVDPIGDMITRIRNAQMRDLSNVQIPSSKFRGRILDVLGRGKVLLNDVKILVIDEADRMLDMGFIHDIKKI